MKPNQFAYFFVIEIISFNFIPGKLPLEKNAIKRRFVIEILSNLDISYRMEQN